MPKRRKSRKPVAEKPEPRESKTRIRRPVLILLIAVVIAAIPFFYGKYVEFSTNSAFDSGSYVYSAKCLVDGQKIGVDINPSARPATLLVNVIGVAIFGFSELGPKIIQMLMQLFAFALMFITLRRLYGDIPAAIALIMGVYYLSCPVFAKVGNVKEQFMIACMIVAACGLLLHHNGGNRLWLILSGAAAINIFYFKPTGVSVMIAMAIYLLVQPLARNRSWRMLGSDVLLLFVGAILGFLPIFILYTWQDRSISILRQTPLLGPLVDFIGGYETPSWAKAISGGSYIAGSRAVSPFPRQFEWVTAYYGSLVAPIGVGLLSIGWGLTRQIRGWRGRLRTRHPDTETEDENGSFGIGDRALLLFGIWWLLDMLFVWISPRSYVEYYLPLLSSAAMLAGYVMHRCSKQPKGWALLLAVWLFVNVVATWVAPISGFPFLGLRSADAVGEYWGAFTLFLVPLVVSVALLSRLKTRRSTSPRITIAVLLCAIMFIWWSAPTMRIFYQKVKQAQMAHEGRMTYPWESVARFIREQTNPDDFLYVWGWYPGIYVQAQRFCPSSLYSYSDMHTDRPREVARKIGYLVEALEENPPKFIVDSQKIHYPFGEHPVYDLWPQWKDRERGIFNFRYSSSEPLKHEGFLTPEEVAEFNELNSIQVEQYSYALLTNEGRKGGPMDRETAMEFARSERRRHAAMAPLREFVVNNYRPVPLGTIMHVFHYKGKE